MTVVDIDNLCLSVVRGKDETQILNGVSFSLESGKITGVAGASGSGKTQTGMALMGLSPKGAQLSGSIRFGEHELVGMPPKEHNALRGTQLSMIFQTPSAAFHPMLTIGDQLTDHYRLHTKASKKDALARACELLAETRVPEPEEAVKKYPHQFSGGQLQRIAIASALMCEPKVLVADEPTTALDVTVQAGILRLLRHLCDQTGVAVLLVTHDFGVLSSVADNIVVIDKGRVVEHGEREQIITRPEHPYTKSLLEALPNREVPASTSADGKQEASQ